MTFTCSAQPQNQQASASAAPQQQQQSPDLLGKNSKTILLIRHGLGFHNIGYDHNLDAHLTARGWAQTAALQQHLQALQPQLGIQLVVVSPLRRTLETAAGVFGAKAPPATAAAAAQAASAAAATATTAAAAAGHHPSWTLMHPQPGRPYEATPQQMLYLPPVQRRAVIAAAGAAAAGAAATAAGSLGSSGAAGAQGPAVEAGVVGDDHQPLKLLAHEGCRERIGPNVCDKFRPISLQAADFPGVDFSLMQHSTDEMWEALHAATCQDGGCYLSGEEERHCEQRALDFYAWLMDRPESVIAVVSHCGFLVHGMRALGKGMFKAWGDAMMLQLKANSSAPNTSALPGTGAGPVNGYIPAAADTSYFAPPGLSLNPLGAQAALDSSSSSAGGSGVDLAAQAAEAVRQSAADLTGWMAADWMNCECRSIQLAWGSSAQLLSGPAATAKAAGAAAGRGGSAPAADRFLFAKPGDGAAWFPGGM